MKKHTLDVICKHCNRDYGQHRSSDDACIVEGIPWRSNQFFSPVEQKTGFLSRFQKETA